MNEPKSKKKRQGVTSIRVPPDVLQAVRDLGVGNMSKLVTGLLKRYLSESYDVEESEGKRIAKLQRQLEAVSKEWVAYCRAKSRKNTVSSVEEVH